jgi:hypothetical protein
MVISGDILEITYNHPTKGSGVIYPKSGEDGTVDLGGFRGNDDAQQIDGGGRNIRQLNRNRWKVEAPVSWDNVNSLELEKVVALAGDPEEADWTVTLISGTVYGGKGAPVGDVAGNTNAGTFTLTLAGGGNLKKIV